MQTEVDRSALNRVVAVVNGKGGVGKTMITANVGGLLAANGQRVLLVDLDPQGNLGEELGYTGQQLDDQGSALAHSLVTSEAARPHQDVRPNLDVLVGGAHLDAAAAGLTMQAHTEPARAKTALALALQDLAPQYDLILIDCPPGQETLQQAALTAARWALIPVKTDASSRKGLRDVARRLDSVLDVNPDLDLLGVVLFGVNRAATRVLESARTSITADLGEGAPVLDSTIRHVEAAAQEARDQGLLVHELEEAVLAGPKWFEVRRRGIRHEGPRSRSATGLADDLNALGNELAARLVAAESEPLGRHHVTTRAKELHGA